MEVPFEDNKDNYVVEEDPEALLNEEMRREFNDFVATLEYTKEQAKDLKERDLQEFLEKTLFMKYVSFWNDDLCLTFSYQIRGKSPGYMYLVRNC